MALFGSGRNPVTVHVVDDQALVRVSLALLLNRAETLKVVGLSASLAQALPLLLEHPCELLVSDIQPDPEYFDELQAIMRHCPRTRVVLLDERVVAINARQAVRLGVGGYLTKQQSPAELQAGLREVHEGGRAFAPAIAARLAGMRNGTMQPGDDQPFSQLTPRELDVVLHIALGRTVKECARALGISASTVDNHKARLMRKLKIHKNVDLTRLALAHGLFDGCATPSAWPTYSAQSALKSRA